MNFIGVMVERKNVFIDIEKILNCDIFAVVKQNSTVSKKKRVLNVYKVRYFSTRYVCYEHYPAF